MKKVIAGAVILASLAAGFTACTETEKVKAIEEINLAKQAFLSLDSVLKPTNNYLIKYKDSLAGIAEKDAASKAKVDSILQLSGKDFNAYDSVTISHGNMAVELEAALHDIETGTLKWEEVMTALPGMKERHESAKKFVDEAAKALLPLTKANEAKNTAENKTETVKLIEK